MIALDVGDIHDRLALCGRSSQGHPGVGVMQRAVSRDICGFSGAACSESGSVMIKLNDNRMIIFLK